MGSENGSLEVEERVVYEPIVSESKSLPKRSIQESASPNNKPTFADGTFTKDVESSFDIEKIKKQRFLVKKTDQEIPLPNAILSWKLMLEFPPRLCSKTIEWCKLGAN